MQRTARLNTYDAILEAGFLILSQNPRASLGEIALAAGVGRATLHRQFKGREDLLHALSRAAAQELEEAANTAVKGAWSNTQALQKILYALVELGGRHGFLMNGIAEQFPDVQAQLDRQNIELADVINGAGKEGLFPASCPYEWVAQSYDLMIYGAWQMVRDGHTTQTQAAKLAWATFKNGLKQAKL